MQGSFIESDYRPLFVERFGERSVWENVLLNCHPPMMSSPTALWLLTVIFVIVSICFLSCGIG